jgi:hypothetical protein
VVRILRAAPTNAPAIAELAALASATGSAPATAPGMLAAAATARVERMAAAGHLMTPAEALRQEMALALDPERLAADARVLVYELGRRGIVIHTSEAVRGLISGRY